MNYVFFFLFSLSFLNGYRIHEGHKHFKQKCQIPLTKAVEAVDIDTAELHLGHVVTFMEESDMSEHSTGIYKQNLSNDDQTNWYNAVKLAHVQIKQTPDSVTRTKAAQQLGIIMLPLKTPSGAPNIRINPYQGLQEINTVMIGLGLVLWLVYQHGVRKYKTR